MGSSLRIVTTLVAGLFLVGGTARAQTLDELIEKNLKAKGGIETLRGTNTVKMTGHIRTQGQDVPMTTWAKRPNLARREVEVTPAPGRPLPPGQGAGPVKVVTATDGGTFWMKIGATPPRELPGPQADAPSPETEFDTIFVDYKQKGIKIELLGAETQNGTPVHHLRVTRKGGPIQHYYLDANTGLESKIRTEVSQDGSRRSIETDLSDYRQVDGRMVPFKTRQSADGTDAEVTLEKIEFNLPLDDAFFKMPK